MLSKRHYRSHRAMLTTGALTLVFSQVRCVQPVAETPNDAPGTVDEVQDAVEGANSRADLVSTIETNPGSWGSWTSYRYCPAGTFATGYGMRVEPLGHEDESTLNAIRLECMDAQGNLVDARGTLLRAQAHDGLWGTWNESAHCGDGGYVTGGAVRFQPSRGSSDDYAASDARMQCSNGSTVQAPGGIALGTWTTPKSCPATTTVCGISVRFESSRQGGDDTALNAMRLACCSNPRASSALRISEHTMDGIRARTFSPDAGPHKAPLILVEAFDSENSLTVDTFPTELPVGFIPALAGMGYSVTVVDLTKNWEAIQSNARRVGALANQLWAESARIRPLKLAGASMGGLIVTTAAAMKDGWATLGETNPLWNFQIDHVTTLDAPHAGVYIPQAIYHLLSRSHAHDDSARLMWQGLTSTATMQMQMIPYNAAYEKAHSDWQNYYRLALDIVQKSDIRFVGVVSGSWSGTTQNPGWTSGALNVNASYRSPAIDLDAELHTQPAPGGKVARINADIFGPHHDDKTYVAYGQPGQFPIIENTAGGYTTHWKQAAKPLGATPKYPNQSFVPTWSAAGISFELYMALPANQRDNLSALEAARGPIAGSPFSPFDRIIAASGVNTQHPKIPTSAIGAFLDEMKTAVALPGYVPAWTGWLSADDPFSGSGDTELLGQLPVPCKKPLTAECRRKSDGIDWKRTGDVMTCTPEGSNCLNANQPVGNTCSDYEVRFACPNPSTVGPWLNRDDPSGNGDGEHLSLLVQAGQTCAEPIGIECQSVGGVDVSATGEKVMCQANRGLICLNADQSDMFCEDYHERFVCPSGGSWTPWLSRDNPGGNGDGEHLGLHVADGKVCPRPLAAECRSIADGRDWSEVGQNMVCNPTQGAICLNNANPGGCLDYQVRFFCPGAWAKP